MYTQIYAELQAVGIITTEKKLSVGTNKRLRENPDIHREVVYITSFLPEDVDIKVRLQCILQDIQTQPVCKVCGKIVHMRDSGRFNNTFPDTCGSKCFSSLQEVVEKRKATNLIKYGHENPQQNEDVKNKKEDTTLARYGHKNAMHSEEVREKQKATLIERYGVGNIAHIPETVAKRKATNVEKYGYENVLASPEMRKRIAATNTERYGVDNPFKLQEFQDKGRASLKERYGVENPMRNEEINEKMHQTMMDRYGVEHALQLEDKYDQMHQTMADRHGVEHALQNPQLLQLARESAQATARANGVDEPAQVRLPEGAYEKLSDAEWLRDQYINKQQTIGSIALALGVAHSTVGLYFKKHNIEVVSRKTSLIERDIADYVRSILPDVEVICNDRTYIAPKELDIVVPSLNLAIEVDGVFWHSEGNGKDKHYHISKTISANDAGFRLIHVYDSEWINTPDIVKSRLAVACGVATKIGARKCSIIQLSSSEQVAFFNQTHIQGAVGCRFCYALKHNNTIVAAMSFGKSRYSKHEWELLRYSTALNTTVVGGASKLFAAFMVDHKPSSVVSYCDLRWGEGRLYHTLGFTYSHASSANYYYFDVEDENVRLMSRISYQKHKLSSKLPFFDEELTEADNMRMNGYDRIWDCGNMVFTYQPCC